MLGDTVIRQPIRRGVYRAAPASSRRQQRGQFGRHAQHWVVVAVELGPFGAEPLGGASLMSLARVRSPATPDHARPPLLRSERIELDRLEFWDQPHTPPTGNSSKASARLKNVGHSRSEP